MGGGISISDPIQFTVDITFAFGLTNVRGGSSDEASFKSRVGDSPSCLASNIRFGSVQTTSRSTLVYYCSECGDMFWCRAATATDDRYTE
jgi:hypothetical protein